MSPTATASVLDYIRTNWPRSFYRDEPGTGFQGVDLPYPYTSPCIKGEGHFTFFFYWDTYFTNIGLLKHGHASVAKDNIKNMLWFIKRQGYMPNHTAIYNRSQAPYLCRMVKEYIEATGDTDFLAEAADGLRQEYHFWTVARHTPTGLSRYGHHDTAEGCVKFYDQSLIRRLNLPADAPFSEKAEIGGQFIANAEATCDFTQRFERRCLDFCAVDLNSLLFEYETYLAECSLKLGWGDHSLWVSRNKRRAELMNRYLWNEERGFFLDYDFVNHRHSKVAAQTGYQALFVGMASPEQAKRMVGNLPLMEREFGMAYTEETPDCRSYQWSYPVAWPPMAYVVVEGLRRYGYEKEARRIAQKYVDTTTRIFEQTGQLWEKVDSETGIISESEYNAAPMLGWSAAVYVAFAEYLA